jgi:hypothetical protein
MSYEIKVVSWNIKDFGTYDYTTTQSSMVETLQDADVVVILEVACDRGSKMVHIGSDATRTDAFNAVEELRAQLEAKDGGTAWSATISGTNSGSQKRDAYAFLWKDEPLNSKYYHLNPPTKIEPDGDPEILDFVLPSPFPDRRPASQSLKVTDSKGVTRSIPIVGFHASVPVNGSTAKKSMDAMGGIVTTLKTTNVIVCSDTNMDFNLNLAFYKSFVTTYGLNVSLGDVNTPNSGISTSLVAKWKDNTDYTSSAYDNIFYKGGNLSLSRAGCIDVILSYGSTCYPNLTSKNQQCMYAWKAIYPKHQKTSIYSGVHAKKPTAMSDHLPVTSTFTVS